MTEHHFLFTELAEDSLTDGRAFDGVAFGKFTDMIGREIELKVGDAGEYVTNTQAAIDATRTESGELVGLPIDAQGHDKGDGAGWIIGVELVEGVIRFLPKWTEIGRELISKGIRRFFSATIDVSNKVVLGGTLTNWPATRDNKNRVMLRPIELSSGLNAVELLEEEPVQAAPISSEEAHMPEDTEVKEAAVETTPSADLAPDVIADLMAQAKDASGPQQLAQMVQRLADQEAERRVQRMLEADRRTYQITELAAKLTGNGQRALPIKVHDLADFLSTLDAEQFQAAKKLFETITENGIIEFEEYGHGRRLRKQPVPQEYQESLEAVLKAGNSAADFFAELGEDPNRYDLSQFEGGK